MKTSPLAPFLEASALFAALGGALGFLGWAALNAAQVPTHLAANALPASDRLPMLLGMMAGAAVTWALAWRCSATGPIERLRLAATRLAPLLALGLMPLLVQWQVWEARPLAGLVFLAATCLWLERAVQASLDVGPCVLPRAFAARVQAIGAALAKRLADRRLAAAAVAGAAAAYAVFFSLFTLHNHHRFATASFDLGIENNLVWNAAHLVGPMFKTSPLGGPDSVHAGYHQTFISYLIAVPYLLWPKPEALLVLQAVVIAAAAVPLFVWLERRLSPWLAALVAIAYLFYPPLHGSNLYDFHYQPFGAFFLFTTLVCFERERWKWGALFAVWTLSLREDMGLMLAVAGAYLVVTRQQPRAGAILAGGSLTVFVVQKLIVMPMLLGGQSAYVHQYAGLIAPGDGGFGGVLKTVFANPGYTLISLLTADKLVYALHVFAPLALLPLRRAVGVWFCLPGFFFTLLSTDYAPLVSIAFQYTAYWSMFVFLATGWTLSQAPAAQRRAMAVALAVGTACATWTFGGWLRADAVKGGFGVHHFTLTAEDERRHADAYTLIDRLPPGDAVSAATYLNPHVSSRPNAYSLAHGTFDAKWILYETATLAPSEKTVVDAAPAQGFAIEAMKGGFVLLKR